MKLILRNKFWFIYRYLRRLRSIFVYRNVRLLLKSKLYSSNTHPSVLFFTTHKTASTFFVKLFQRSSDSGCLIPIDFDSYFAIWEIGVSDKVSRKEFGRNYHKRGFIFGPMRSFRPVPDIDDYQILLILRDPRDVLVSLYFSTAFSHPTMSSEFKRRKLEAQALSLDEFVLKEAPQILKIYEDYSSLLGRPNLLFISYESIKADPEHQLRSINAFCELGLSQSQINDIVLAEFEPSEGTENIYKHKRSGISGQYKTKLASKTIELLNARFAPIISVFRVWEL